MKMNIKKLIYICVAALVLINPISCKKEDKSVNVSFATPFPIVSNEGVATLTISSNYKGTEVVKIPVNFTGKAVKGTNYTVSAEEFVLGGSNPVTQITVTPKDYSETENTVKASLKIPAGFVAGKYPIVDFSLVFKLGYASFETDKAVGLYNYNIVVNVFDAASKPKKMDNKTKIKVKVDESSTAVEGKHFSFVGEPVVEIDKGKSSGKLTLNIVQPFVEGKDEIVIALDDPRFISGDYSEMKIMIKSVEGKWKVAEIHPTPQEQKDNMSATDADLKGYPVFNDSDYITLNTEKGELVQDVKSDLKNFFLGTSKMVKDRVYNKFAYSLDGNNNKKIDIQLFNLDNVNRNFDSASKSADKNAYIGFRMSKDNKGADILSLYILDYRPTSFLMPYYGFGLFPEQRPSAIDTYAFIVLNCTRVE